MSFMPSFHELDDYWQSVYSGCEPYLLRDKFRGRWVRFHSLPKSKRYAESDAEYRTILARHNAIIGSMAKPGEELLLISTGYSLTSDSIRDDSHLTRLDPTAQFWRTIARHVIEDDAENPNYWHLFVSTWSWKSRVFDQLFRLVADDVIADIHVVSRSSQWAFHPYDGGADVILCSHEERDRLRDNFTAWLSSREDGF